MKKVFKSFKKRIGLRIANYLYDMPMGQRAPIDRFICDDVASKVRYNGRMC